MIDELRRLLEKIPFLPFTILTSSGQRYEVKSLDHINIGPTAKLVAIWHDDGTFTAISPLHIAALEGVVSDLTAP